MSGESAMYRYGLFQNTVSEIEIVLADGTVTTANRDHNTELLHEAGGSLGTFGVVTLLTIELLPATSHVQVQVIPIKRPLTIPGIFEGACHDPDIDYIDGIYFNAHSAVVMFGKLIDYNSTLRDPQAPLLNTKQVHWFAETIRKHLAAHGEYLDTNTNKEAAASPSHANHTAMNDHGIIPDEKLKRITPILMTLTDYLFRYDHGAFWGGTLAFRHFHVPQNAFTRTLADPFLDSRTCYHALHKTGLADEYVVQDFGIPASSVTAFMEYVAKEMPECMIFLCPLRPAKDIHIDKRFNEKVFEVKDQRIFGVGVYGRGPRESAAFHELNRRLELKASELLGAKLLYARTYYTADEFWTIYNKQYYDEVRTRWNATSLPSVYDKLHADMKVMRPRRSVRGVLETIWDKTRGNKEYLLAKG